MQTIIQAKTVSLGKSIRIKDLLDVQINSPSNGQVLLYNSTLQKFVNSSLENLNQVNSDWNAISGVSQILNKPAIGEGLVYDTETNIISHERKTIPIVSSQPTRFIKNISFDQFGHVSGITGGNISLAGLTGNYNDLNDLPIIPQDISDMNDVNNIIIERAEADSLYAARQNFRSTINSIIISGADSGTFDWEDGISDRRLLLDSTQVYAPTAENFNIENQGHGNPITVDITFKVDMIQAIEWNLFNKDINSIDVRGTFNGFSSGDTLTETDTPGIYKITKQISGFVGEVIEYKFYVNGGGPIESWEPGSNRIITLPNSSTYVLPVVRLNWNDLRVTQPIQIRLELDCTQIILAKEFNPTNEFLEVRGNFNGFSGGENWLLTQAGDSNIFSIQFELNAAIGDSIAYKFFISPPSFSVRPISFQSNNVFASGEIDANGTISAPNLREGGSFLSSKYSPLFHQHDYNNDIINKPTLFSGNYSDLSGKPNLATVATSGSYNDLLNKPESFDFESYQDFGKNQYTSGTRGTIATNKKGDIVAIISNTNLFVLKNINGYWIQKLGLGFNVNAVGNIEDRPNAIAFNGDGTLLAIGLPNETNVGIYGAVLLYELNLDNSYQYNGGVTQVQYLTSDEVDGEFGYAVALNDKGNILAASRPGYNNASGEVLVYNFDISTTPQRLTSAAGIYSNERFGYSLAINSDGTHLGATKLLINPDLQDGDNLNIYYSYTTFKYTLNNNVWTNESTWSLPSESNNVIPSYPKIALSGDGFTIAFSVYPGDNNTSLFRGLYFLRREILDWSVPSNWPGLSYPINPSTLSKSNANERFGNSLALNYDGSMLAFGNPGDSVEGENFGEAYIFELIGSSNLYQLKKVFKGSSTNRTNQYFGSSVCLSEIGDVIHINSVFDAASYTNSIYNILPNINTPTEDYHVVNKKYVDDNAGSFTQVNADWNATSGVEQILNKPVLFDGNYNSLSNLPTLFDGNYNSLSNLPFIPQDISELSDNYNLLGGSTFSGSYNDLTDKPTLFSGNYSDLSGAPTLATVATSGSYDDLSNKPNTYLILHAGHGGFTAVAGGATNYFDLRQDLAPGGVNLKGFGIPFSGTIISIGVVSRVGGTVGVNQGGSVDFYLYENETATSTLLHSTPNNSLTASFTGYSQTTDLNVPINANTRYSIRIDTPTFTTAATTVRHDLVIIIKPN
jgi:hypothetical protein